MIFNYATQEKLLDNLWPLVKPDGLLVYATCSIFKAENEDQITNFLHRHNDAKTIEVKGFGLDRGVGAQSLPGFENKDGFFISVLEENNLSYHQF